MTDRSHGRCLPPGGRARSSPSSDREYLSPALRDTASARIPGPLPLETHWARANQGQSTSPPSAAADGGDVLCPWFARAQCVSKGSGPGIRADAVSRSAGERYSRSDDGDERALPPGGKHRPCERSVIPHCRTFARRVNVSQYHFAGSVDGRETR